MEGNGNALANGVHIYRLIQPMFDARSFTIYFGHLRQSQHIHLKTLLKTVYFLGNLYFHIIRKNKINLIKKRGNVRSIRHIGIGRQLVKKFFCILIRLKRGCQQFLSPLILLVRLLEVRNSRPTMIHFQPVAPFVLMRTLSTPILRRQHAEVQLTRLPLE